MCSYSDNDVNVCTEYSWRNINDSLSGVKEYEDTWSPADTETSAECSELITEEKNATVRNGRAN